LVGHRQSYSPTYRTLAGKARLEAGHDGTVDVVLFALAHLGQLVHALVYVHLAGGAGADPAAVVVQLDVVVEGEVQDGFTSHGSYRDGRYVLLDKAKGDFENFHGVRSAGAKVDLDPL
jgi:hypothetical protein